jgi:2-dehydropantoate 2-reductase
LDQSRTAPVYLVLVTLKSYDTEAASDTVNGILSDEGVVLTLRNGVGNFEVLDKAFPGRVLTETTPVGAIPLGPGRFRHTGFGVTHLGEPDGSVQDRTPRGAEALRQMKGGDVQVIDNAMGCVWSKLILNAAINAPGTLLSVRNGDIPRTESGRRLIHDIVSECMKVVEAKGIRLIFDDPEAHVLEVCKGTAANFNSMFQDVLAGRRTEIDFINGAVAREAELLGVSAPVNRTLSLLIKAMEGTAERRVG